MTSNTNKTKINFYIDLVLLFLFAALIGLGILIKFVLIPGQERWMLYGDNIELTFWGMNRHEWGTVHLVIGIVFFIAFVFHLIYHWKMIKCMFRNCISRKPNRILVSVVSIGLFVLLIVFPFFVNPEKEPVNRGFGALPVEEMGIDLNDSIRLELKKPKHLDGDEKFELQLKRKNKQRELNIKGSMTLSQISQKYLVDEELLKRKLDIPAEASADQQIGRLKKQYDFEMEELKSVIREEIKKRREEQE